MDVSCRNQVRQTRRELYTRLSVSLAGQDAEVGRLCCGNCHGDMGRVLCRVSFLGKLGTSHTTSRSAREVVEKFRHRVDGASSPCHLRLLFSATTYAKGRRVVIDLPADHFGIGDDSVAVFRPVRCATNNEPEDRSGACAAQIPPRSQRQGGISLPNMRMQLTRPRERWAKAGRLSNASLQLIRGR
jgi:hypothetical protein